MGTPTPARPRTIWWVIGLGLVALLLVVYPGWRRILDKGDRPMDGCQQDGLVIHLPGGDTVTGGELPLIGPIADLPEYHDCQRFVLPAQSLSAQPASAKSVAGRDGSAYGPLVAIWAANNLAEQPGLTALPSTPTDTRVSPGAPPSREITTPGIKAIPVAVIYNFEKRDTYEQLAISPGFSCLYIWKSNTWQARLVSLGKSTTPCLDPMDTTSREIVAAPVLQVIPAELPAGLTPDDIPPVARWDWDAKHGWQYIGIRCANEWCEIGKPGFAPSRAAVGTPTGDALFAALEDIPLEGFAQATRAESLRVVGVKGWYDEQRLDDLTAFRRLRLTEVVGTVFPHPALGRLPDTAFLGRWIPAAYAQAPEAYHGQVPLAQGMSRLYMCQGTAAGCPGADATKTCSKEDQDPDDLWWAKIVSADGTTRFLCVRRRTHGGVAIPAAATRWNWNSLDAKTWIACQGGCCTVN